MTSLNIDSWSPDEVAKWVKGLGDQFEDHSQSFVDEEITGKALLTINAEYLKELSIENAMDQNVVLEAVHCLLEVDTCLRGETVQGQVVVVNDRTKMLIEQLEKECKEATEGDIQTTGDSMKMAGQVYQLAKKLLSWLIRSPFSEMNACWPLKDSVCRVVRDMTDESLLKNRGHLQENLKKLQASFDNFLQDDQMHEVFKQPPVLKTEDITLEGEGLGIGITTSHNVHTVNSVAAESPAGKSKHIKNGDEIVKVNGHCVIAWTQKNVVKLMKSNPESVSLTLKKLPSVEGPLNKPCDKLGTPLSEVEVIMDRTQKKTERTTRVEMKEAGIKEETSLEMQAIENENEVEESSMSKVEEEVEEEVEEKPEGETTGDEANGKETKKDDVTEDKDRKEQGEEIKEEEPKETKDERVDEKPAVEEKLESKDETETPQENHVESIKEEEKEIKSKEKKVEAVELKNEEEKAEKEKEVDVEKQGEGMVKTDEIKKDDDETVIVVKEVDTSAELKVAETLLKSEVTPAKETTTEETKVQANSVTEETKKTDDEKKATEPEDDKKEDSKEVQETITNEGEPSAPVVKTEEQTQKVEQKEMKETAEKKPEAVESKTLWYDGGNEPKEAVKQDDAKAPPPPEVQSSEAPQDIKLNGETEDSPSKKDVEVSGESPGKKPARPDFPKMKIGSVKNVTVKGESAKQVELFSAPKVVRREKKTGGTPDRRISCIDLGEADCEGWLTKKSGGHGLTPTRWKRQWCVLKDEHLYYYKTSFDREAGGVIDITGYTISTAPETKKPFAFKCEKDGAKKYHFHADNEVDRDRWITNLNFASRGEKLKDIGGGEENDASGGKQSNSLKVAPIRPRASSVLAGIRFNYYDEELGDEKNRNLEKPSSTVTAKRINDSVDSELKNTNESSVADDKPPGNNVLKLAAGVEEDADPCQVIPVEELQDEKGKGGTSEAPADDKSSSGGKDAKSEDPEGNSDTKEQAGTPEEKNDSKEPERTSEDTSGTKEQTSTSEEKSETKNQVGTTDEVDNENKVGAVSEEVTESVKSETDVAEKPEKVDDNLSDETHESDEKKPESSEEGKDEFKEMAESIKGADINFDGTERRSPQALLRKLSLNSQNDIMEKVVKLRVLKQSLKDKEEAMNTIDELLSSDVTPETISEWRTKFKSVVENSSESSSDLNENSSL